MHSQIWSHIWSRSVHQSIQDVQTPGQSRRCECERQRAHTGRSVGVPHTGGETKRARRVIDGAHLDQCQVFQIKPEEVISVKRKDGRELDVSYFRHFLKRTPPPIILQA